MSYDLNLWAPLQGKAAPATFEQAWQELQSLASAKAKPDRRMLAFLRELSSKYPQEAWVRDAAVADPDAQDDAVLRIALPAGERLRVMEFMVLAAGRNGLMLLDEQVGMAFTPAGKVLPPEQAQTWAAIRRELASRAPAPRIAEARKQLAEIFVSVLAPHGFERQADDGWDVVLTQRFDGGELKVAAQLRETNYEYLLFGASLSVTHDSVAALVEEVVGKSLGGGGPWSLLLSSEDLSAAGTVPEVRSAADLHAIAALVANKGVPVLKACRDLAQVDQLVNREGRYVSWRGSLPLLVIAALARNPEYDRIVREAREATSKRPQDSRDLLEKMIVRLQPVVAAG